MEYLLEPADNKTFDEVEMDFMVNDLFDNGAKAESPDEGIRDTDDAEVDNGANGDVKVGADDAGFDVCVIMSDLFANIIGGFAADFDIAGGADDAYTNDGGDD